MENKLIPAPIDNKNVMTDWIEEIFDFQTAVRRKKTMVGFIADEPAVARWNDNVLIWTFPLWPTLTIEDSKPLEELKKRLKVYDDANVELITIDNVDRHSLMQKFFWKKD